jgi:hypothetical protein
VLNGPAPLAELRKLLPDSDVVFDSGAYPAQAAMQARRADVAVVFANKFESEGFDSPDLTLPYGAGRWRVADGVHRVAVSRSAADPSLTGGVWLSARVFGQ